MKGYGSVLMLLARSSIYKILGILAGMSALQAGLFRYTLHRRLPAAEFGLEAALRQSGALYLFGAAALLITLALSAVGCDGSARPGYTLRRLRVPEKGILLLQWGYNSLCYLILWGVQLAVALGLCRLWTVLAPDQTTTQTVFLAFYRSEFLHPLLPLQDGLLWARNAVLVLTLGAATAAYPYRQRRGKKQPTALLIAVGMAGVFWPGKLGDWAGQIPLLLGCLFVLMTFAACFWEEDEPDA